MRKDNSKNISPTRVQKTKSMKRFHILFTEEEWDIIQKESQERGITVSELIRKSIFSEIKKVTNMEKILALNKLTEISD